jgi:hypothetical protein
VQEDDPPTASPGCIDHAVMQAQAIARQVRLDAADALAR